MRRPSMMEYGDDAAERLKAWKRKQMWQNIGFVLLAIAAICIAVFAVGGIFSAIGYPIILMAGATYTFWSSAAAGFGTLVLLIVLFTGVGHLLSSARGKSDA